MRPQTGMRNYLIAAAVLVAGMAVFALLLLRGLSGLGDTLERVVVPGSHRLALDEPGGYTLFYEHRSVVGDRVFNTGEAIPPLRLELRRADSGEAVPIDTAVTSSYFSVGSRQGVAVAAFEIAAAGGYELTVEGDGPEVVLSYGKGFHKRLFTTILSSIAVMLVTVPLALGIALVTLIRQLRARRAAGAEAGAAPTSPV